MPLTPGANLPVPTAAVRAVLSWQPGPDTPEIDVSALLLGASGAVRDDADLVFYNQPRHVSGAVRQDGSTVEVDLADVEPEVERIVLAASAEGGTFGQVGGLELRLFAADGGAVADFPMTATTETALVGGELYRRGEGWKFRAVGQGYDSGLAGLATDFGIAVDEEPATEVVDEPAGMVDEPARGAHRPAARGRRAHRRAAADPARAGSEARGDSPAAAAARLEETRARRPRPSGPPISRRSRSPSNHLRWTCGWSPGSSRSRRRWRGRVPVTARARVVLVLDASGSMSTAYIDGVVGRIAERCAAVAAVLDIGVLPVWKFAETAMRLPDLHADRAADWARGLDYHGVGLQNDEPAAIRAVLEHAGSHPDPTLVLFFADGDVRRNVETNMLMRTSAGKPVFWQFVGLGRADFTRYAKLDTMRLRKVDNCGFVSVHDPDRIPDGRFYDLLLGEFPRWLTAARAKGIVSG